MVMRHVFPQQVSDVALPQRTTRSRHSSLIDRTNRSVYAFAFGARTGVWTTRTPPDANTARTAVLHYGIPK